MYRERFIALVESAKEDECSLKFIEGRMNAMCSYVKAVYAMEVQIKTLRFRLEGEEFRDAVETLDRRRRSAHEAAIASCTSLNRVAQKYGTEALFDGDLTDREHVAQICIDVVDEIFNGRDSCSVADLIQG